MEEEKQILQQLKALQDSIKFLINLQLKVLAIDHIADGEEESGDGLDPPKLVQESIQEFECDKPLRYIR